MLVPRTALPPTPTPTPTITSTITAPTPTPPQPPAHSRRQICFKRRDIDFNFFQFLCQERKEERKKKWKKRKRRARQIIFRLSAKKNSERFKFFSKMSRPSKWRQTSLFSAATKKRKKNIFSPYLKSYLFAFSYSAPLSLDNEFNQTLLLERTNSEKVCWINIVLPSLSKFSTWLWLNYPINMS